MALEPGPPPSQESGAFNYLTTRLCQDRRFIDHFGQAHVDETLEQRGIERNQSPTFCSYVTKQPAQLDGGPKPVEIARILATHSCKVATPSWKACRLSWRA